MESHFKRMFNERNIVTKTCVICNEKKNLPAHSTSLLTPYTCKGACTEKYMNQIEERENNKVREEKEREEKKISVPTPIEFQPNKNVSHSEPLN